MPAVSVIVPVYNSARFLAEAVESVFRQTFTDWELILVDDGSTDDSPAVAAAYADKDAERVRLLYHPGRRNHGVSATRNRGIAAAAGEYLAFLDADDVWLPHRLACQVPILAEHPEVGLVYGLSACVGEDGRPLTLRTGPFGYLGEYGVGVPGLPFNAYPGFLVGNLFAPVSTVLARRRIVSACGGFSLGLRFQIEDQVMWTRLARNTLFYFVNQVVALYRVHPTSWSSRQTTLSRLDMQLEHLQRLATEDPPIDPLLADGIAYFVKHYWQRQDITLRFRLKRTGEILAFLRSHGQLAGVVRRYLVRQRRKGFRRLAGLIGRRGGASEA